MNYCNTPDDNQPTMTSLFGLIKFAIDHFNDSETAPNLRRHIVVFSDGSDVVSALELENITNQAATHNITISTVEVGNSGFRDTTDNLQRIAILSNGRYNLLDTIDSLNTQWEYIASQRGQRILTYRTDNPESGMLKVIAHRPNGKTIDAEINFPRVGARPMRIDVLQPESGQVFERVADHFRYAPGGRGYNVDRDSV